MNTDNPDLNSRGETFFTGLPPGPGHDRMVLEGFDFIVFQIEEHRTECACGCEGYDQGPYVIPNCNLDALSVLSWAAPFMDWCRVRAMSEREAIAAYPNAIDQHVSNNNSSPHWRWVGILAWSDDRQARVRDFVFDGGTIHAPHVRPQAGRVRLQREGSIT